MRGHDPNWSWTFNWMSHPDAPKDFKVISTSSVGLELTTPRLRLACSTCWASQVPPLTPAILQGTHPGFNTVHGFESKFYPAPAMWPWAKSSDSLHVNLPDYQTGILVRIKWDIVLWVCQVLHKLKELWETHSNFSRPGHISKKIKCIWTVWTFLLKTDNSERNVAC